MALNSHKHTGDNDPQAGEWELTARPPSPWGARYGVHTQRPRPFVHTNRSWLSPSFPTFSPRDALKIRGSIPEDGDGSGEVETPIGEEADRLFTSEVIQMQRFAGLRTWEAILVKDVSRYAEGHELVTPGNASKELAIVEELWFAVFRKNRWIDYHLRLQDSAIDCPRTNFDPDGIWSASNPEIWRELCPSIELANRILHQACHGPW